MVYVYFAATHSTAINVSSYLRTWHIVVHYNADMKMYYVVVTHEQEMKIVASAFNAFGIFV